MLDTIKSDLRKLLTVRSTYFLIIVGTLLASFIAFYVEAWWGKTGDAAGRMSLTPEALHTVVTSGAGAIATFACLVAILQVGHEYRYNTIMYTLTASSSRLKVFLSKMLTLTGYALAASSLALIVVVGMYFLGLSLRGADLPAQHFNVLPELARVAFYFMLYGMFGFLLGVLLRSLVAAIVVVFLLPSMVEPLLSLLLKGNSKYLPSSAFDGVIGMSHGSAALSANAAVLVSLVYLAVLSLAAWILFLRRDAN
jgi:ABC-2 type transport system permease protein